MSEFKLQHYDAACAALAKAARVDEVKQIRDAAEATRVYARQAKNRDLEIQAAEIRLRAERRVGQLMARQREAGMLASGRDSYRSDLGLPKNPRSAPTLAELGVDKNFAHRARRLAAIPDEIFEAHMPQFREEAAAGIRKATESVTHDVEYEAERKKQRDYEAATGLIYLDEGDKADGFEQVTVEQQKQEWQQMADALGHAGTALGSLSSGISLEEAIETLEEAIEQLERYADRVEKNPPPREQVESIRASGQRVVELINRIMRVIDGSPREGIRAVK